MSNGSVTVEIIDIIVPKTSNSLVNIKEAGSEKNSTPQTTTENYPYLFLSCHRSLPNIYYTKLIRFLLTGDACLGNFLNMSMVCPAASAQNI
ncbi:MAG TPA: hypothetical protein VNI77_06520 [Nitrososphaera sp.]|nr:hypothetical protein [Nitrososphaera sp.]